MTDLPQLDWSLAPAFRTAPIVATTVNRGVWSDLAKGLSGDDCSLLSLWAEPDAVFMAIMRCEDCAVAVARLETDDGRFPSVGLHHPPAQRLERAASDLFGLRAAGATDLRPWLDHGRWPQRAPMGAQGSVESESEGQQYSFLPVEGESLHQVPVGPVHAGIIEPGHFRFTAQGETVVRLEERFGYVHKGVDRLMQGATLARGAELAGRVSGDSTVAYSWAFAQAAEAALGLTLPARALALRGIMAELERLANHLGDIGAVCNDAAFPMMLAQTSILREKVLRTAKAAFGQRAMRDCVLPGGVVCDLAHEGERAIADLLDDIRAAFPGIVALYDNAASLLDRTVGTGHLSQDLARKFAAGGVVGRASGRDFDVRRDQPYAPYDFLQIDVPRRIEGDVDARIWVRIKEVEQSCSLISQMLNSLPSGPIAVDLPTTPSTASGLGLVEGFRGDIMVWINLRSDGTIRRCHLRDPSWFQWPLLEAAIEGNIIADFPLCNKSFNCSYSGPDL